MKFPKDYTILIFLHALYDALFMKSLSTAVYATLWIGVKKKIGACLETSVQHGSDRIC